MSIVSITYNECGKKLTLNSKLSMEHPIRVKTFEKNIRIIGHLYTFVVLELLSENCVPYSEVTVSHL